MTRDRAYLLATLLLSLPVTLLVYLLISGQGAVVMEGRSLHLAFLWLTFIVAGVLGVVALRSHMQDGAPTTAALALGLLCFDGPWFWQAWYATVSGATADFALYGPEARIVFAVSFISLAAGPVRTSEGRRRTVALAVGGAVVVALVSLLATRPVAAAAAGASPAELRATLAAVEAGAAVLAGSAAIYLATVGKLPTTAALPVGIGLAAEQSLLYILAVPWTALWWIAHMVSLLSLFLVAGSVLVVFRTHDHERELARLREVDRAKSTFINTAAHELRTPLMPIRIQIHLLRKRLTGRLSQEETRSLDVLDRNVERMGRLVQDVLEAARLETGALQVKRTPVGLDRVVLEAAESFQAVAESRRIEVELHAVPGVVVEGDDRRLHQVLTNLLNNASRFTPEGGHVSIELRRSGPDAVVTVRDDGAGIPVDAIDRLFQPFSQAHDPMQRTDPGAGLGLFICRGIVERHGGRIWCESDGPGLGAAFSFTVPLAPSPFHTTGVPPAAAVPAEE